MLVFVFGTRREGAMGPCFGSLVVVVVSQRGAQQGGREEAGEGEKPRPLLRFLDLKSLRSRVLVRAALRLEIRPRPPGSCGVVAFFFGSNNSDTTLSLVFPM